MGCYESCYETSLDPLDICSDCHHYWKDHNRTCQFEKCTAMAVTKCPECKHNAHSKICNKHIDFCSVCSHYSHHNNSCNHKHKCPSCGHDHPNQNCYHTNEIGGENFQEAYQSPIYKKIKVLEKVKKSYTSINQVQRSRTVNYTETHYTSGYGSYQPVAVNVPCTRTEFYYEPVTTYHDKEIDEEIEKTTNDIIGYETKYKTSYRPISYVNCSCQVNYIDSCQCSNRETQTCQCSAIFKPHKCTCRSFKFSHSSYNYVDYPN